MHLPTKSSVSFFERYLRDRTAWMKSFWASSREGMAEVADKDATKSALIMIASDTARLMPRHTRVFVSAKVCTRTCRRHRSSRVLNGLEIPLLTISELFTSYHTVNITS